MKSENLKAVYLLPGADFRGYSKIMLDPPEVDFVKGWVRHMNSTYDFSMGQTSDIDAKQIAAEFRKGVADIFAKAFAKAGYPIVTEPGPDVLRVTMLIFNLSITAPYTVTSGIQTVRTVDAGSAAIILEVRDSDSGQVLGRALNQGIAGRNDEASPRSETGNRFDFSQLFDKWADFSVKGLAALKAASPVDAAGAPAKPAS